jgi:hypothetical protein
MYNLNYKPRTFGLQSWREIISGGTTALESQGRMSIGLLDVTNSDFVDSP